MSEKTLPVTHENHIPTKPEEEAFTRPPVDIYENSAELVVICDLPGISSDHVDVDVDNDILTISGKTEFPAHPEESYREFNRMSFYRQFELSEEVDPEKISADFKNGVLTLRLPKTERPEPRKITIKAA